MEIKKMNNKSEKSTEREKNYFYIEKETLYNLETLTAIEEVQRLKANKNKKSYTSFKELLDDLNND